jgi:plasmid maintenance system antidote protein VapI
MNRKLKAKIIENHGSQWQFAHALGIHESEVSRIIRGTRTLNPEDRRKWAEALSVKEEEIFRDGNSVG